MSISSEYLYLPGLVLVFLIIDLLIEVGSLTALLSNLFFWLYGFVYSVAAETALYFLGNATSPVIASLPKPVLILIAITATTTVLQSLTFKVGGRKVLDLSQHLEDYRKKVLSSSASLATTYESRSVLSQSRKILKKVAYVPGDPASEARMKQMYAGVMLFGRRDPAKVQQEIAKAEQICSQTGAPFGNEVAQRIAQADPEWVRNFLAN